MMWAGFLLFVVLMLALDLGVFHRTSHTVTAREALAWTVVWVACALGFAGLVHYGFGADKAMEFLTGYAIEKALAIDNIFVFVAVFGAFAVPAAYQHRVLFYGVLGALAMRAAFIFAGSALIMRFHWVLYVFGALLLLTGVRMLTAQGGPPEDVSKNRLLVVLRRWVPSTEGYRGDAFFTVENGRRLATPLFFVLHPRHLRRDDRPLHRLHIKYLRYPRFEVHVFLARGSRASLRVPEGGSGAGPDVRRLQDADHGVGEAAHAPVAGRRADAGGGLDPRVPAGQACRSTDPAALMSAITAGLRTRRSTEMA